MFFLYGLGANGKSVFLNTVTGILGDYHTVAPTEMLLASKHERHPTELAGLVGRRLVTARDGRRQAMGRDKDQTLTGGERWPPGSCVRTFLSSRRVSSSSVRQSQAVP